MQSIIRKKEISNRTALLDCLRGFTVISMVLYHAMWDMVNLFDFQVPWFHGLFGFVWQQATCCIFILLSGFCSAFGRHPLKRGGMVFGLGAAVSLITAIFMPEEVILFGVLTLIGSCMLFAGAVKPFLMKIPAGIGLFVCMVLFVLTRNVNDGMIGFFSYEIMELPEWLYQNYFTAYLGFPHDAFRSTDYFSVMPWLFLFLSGFFLFGLCGREILSNRWKGLPLVNLIGRQALFIYVLHQPVIYGVLRILSSLWL